ncbi:MAG TPA: twin-arginine translocase subunit TatC, partial [Methylomirabilota bacterium]|nr:twin-arginine translocase subunit TatC [Methylomirabilota bacterium]
MSKDLEEEQRHTGSPVAPPHKEYQTPPPAPPSPGSDEDSDDEEGGPVKSFLEHLEDLRWVLIKSGAALLIAMVLCMVAAPVLTTILTWPLENSGENIKLEFLSPMGGFMVTLKVAFWGGMILALPAILFFLGDFVVPALKRNER